MGRMHIEKNIFRFISPMAVGFVIIASYRIGKKVIKGKTTFFLWCFGAITTYFIREPWIFPLVLIFGGIVSIFFSNEKGIWNKVYLNPSWRYLIIFLTLIIATLLSSILFDNRLISIFESFYRYGYLVIGGGQVVIPLMYGELVEINKYMTSQEFLTGFGLVQGLPGPMFSFSAFAGGLAARGNGIILQVAGALAGAIGIFLPGLLLIYFVYPLWEELKRIRGIKISLSGIIAVAGGLVFITSIILMQKISFSFTNISIVVLTVIALISKKIPSPLIVLFMIILGIIF
jgi:chromate transporter